ncbi:type I restriction endonuclease, partial [Bradyrhizobium sp. P5_C12]
MTDLYPIASSGSAFGFREEAVELAALSWFDLIGWKTVPGDQLSPDGPMGARTSYKQAVLEPELRSALATLNPDASPATIDAAVRTVLATPSQDVIENNRVFHPLLASGIPVEVSQDGETRTIGLRLLDRSDPTANRLLVANQFIIQGADERDVVRADVVVFVNGLPLGLLELKSPTDAQATLGRAHTQLQNYRSKVPELLRFNQVLIISDGLQARIGSLTAGLDRFAPWRTIDGSTLDDTGRSELEVLIRGVFAPERFLDLIVDYIAFEVVDGVVHSKKLAGYHQFHAVRKALASTIDAAGARGQRRGGVVWHTQGSGKSLTMLFFVRQLQLA